MSEGGVAVQLRKLQDNLPIPKFNWETHENAGYNRAIKDVLEVLANHVCVNNSPELLEKLAELEHQQWSHWIQYQHSLRKSMVNYVYAQKWKDWLKLSRTPYAELSEREKELDRQWALKVLEVLRGGVEAT